MIKYMSRINNYQSFENSTFSNVVNYLKIAKIGCLNDHIY